MPRKAVIGLAVALFHDAPLGEGLFRLFKLSDKDPSPNDISLELNTFHISQAPSYTAISYCWGDKSDGTATISCCGSPLEVWRNIYDLLRRIQREHSKSWYWCDAICIKQGGNQVAVSEKRQQIAFMETIFSQAKPVQIWLGDASADEESAFLTLAAICEKTNYESIEQLLKAFPDEADPVWQFWTQILVRDWFGRIWTVQEALLNQPHVTVSIGRYASIAWECFRYLFGCICIGYFWKRMNFSYTRLDKRAQLSVERYFLRDMRAPRAESDKADASPGLGIIEHSEEHMRDDAVSECLIRHVRNTSDLTLCQSLRNSGHASLVRLLTLFGNRRCAYNQDRPNAMRGLLGHELAAGLRIYDVEDDLSLVYRDATRQLLLNDPTLSLLQCIRPLNKFFSTETKEDVLRTVSSNPTWALDFGHVVNTTLCGGNQTPFDGFHAGQVKARGPDGRNRWSISREGPTICVPHIEFIGELQCAISGLHISAVEEVVSSKPSVHIWVNSALRLISSASNIDRDAAVEIYWRAFDLQGIYQAAEIDQKPFDVANRGTRWAAYVEVMRILQSDDPDSDVLSSGTEAAKCFEAINNGHFEFPNWYTTSNGLIGRSSALPQPGDVVAIFLGATTTYLLRPVMTDKGEPAFGFMGESYTHGIMQGEALLPENSHRFPSQRFLLV